MLQRITKFLLLASLLGEASLRAQSTPILSVTFEGNNAVQTPLLKNQLRVCREGGWYNADMVKAELQGLEAFYQDEGFLRAKVGDPVVELRPIPGKGQGAVIRVPVTEGARYSLGELRIQNAQGFKPATLLRLSPLGSGQPYSRSKLAQWQEKIEDAYHTMGYIRAEFRLQEEIHEVRKIVDVVLDCNEGPAYRVGKITVPGDDSINTAEFKKQLLVGEGGLYNPEMLGLTLHFLNNMRAYKTISPSDVEVRINDASATVDLIFHVTPLKKGPSSFGAS